MSPGYAAARPGAAAIAGQRHRGHAVLAARAKMAFDGAGQDKQMLRALRQDLAAAIALAAVAIPSQMATAHLAGFPPSAGLAAFVAGSAGFALFGTNRLLVVCADSTIAPIFAAELAGLSQAAGTGYFELASSFALITGTILICIGVFRLGWLADIVSIPVIAGFLAGIAAHIIVSQLPYLLGIALPDHGLLQSLLWIGGHFKETNPASLALGLGVLAAIAFLELVSPRIPGALAGIIAAAGAAYWFSLERIGVALLGASAGGALQLRLPLEPAARIVSAIPLAIAVAAVIVVQTAATLRTFNPREGAPPSLGRDFAAVGAGNLLAGVLGAFAVNASPPLTETVTASGGRSKFTLVAAALLLLALSYFGAKLMAFVPLPAIAAVLVFIAIRILRLQTIAAIFRSSFGEFLLVIATFAAIVALPVGAGVGTGIVLSLLHGIWSMTRARLITFEKVPGTSIWWPPGPGLRGETLEGVLVVAFQAPLTFLNAYEFQAGVRRAITQSSVPPLRLIVIEASSIAEIDYTAAQVLLQAVRECAQHNIDIAIARLESLRAQEAFERFGIIGAVPRDHVFRSVDEAIKALAKKDE